MPRAADTSGGFFRRWLVVPFNTVFSGKTAIPAEMLDAQLAKPTELSGVLNKALSALPRLRGGFTESASMKKAWEELRATTDPLAVWLDQCTVSSPESVIPCAELLRAYNQSAREHGDPWLSQTGFGLAMNRLRPGTRRVYPTINSVRTHCYAGLAWRDGAPGGEKRVRSRTHPLQTVQEGLLMCRVCTVCTVHLTAVNPG
jgi:putative DNA primase/helicase